MKQVLSPILVTCPYTGHVLDVAPLFELLNRHEVLTDNLQVLPERLDDTMRFVSTMLQPLPDIGVEPLLFTRFYDLMYDLRDLFSNFKVFKH